LLCPLRSLPPRPTTPRSPYTTLFRSGDAIFAGLKEHLGIGNDETTRDGMVTLEHIECNAACDYAPVVMVNWEFFDNQTVQSARRSEEHTSELQSRVDLVCRLLLEKKK